jgi:Ca-activated chloride channel family protein
LAAAGSSGRRRHVAPALFLAAVTLLLLALARPEATVSQPRREGTVILAFDVSGSMAATDLAPSRILAAKSAARAFVDRQPATVRVGVVAFSGSGLVTQRPTTDRVRVLDAINRLTPQGGTALGRGLQSALSAIVGRTVQLDASDGSVEVEGPDLGYHGSAAVILLSDGENTAEPDPIGVAELASTAGVRVYPIGLGTAAGTVLEIDGFRVATSLDESLLREIASTTDARYFAATDEKALADVYSSIDLAWTVEAERTEVTALLAAAAALLLLLGAALSLAWFGRVV